MFLAMGSALSPATPAKAIRKVTGFFNGLGNGVFGKGRPVRRGAVNEYLRWPYEVPSTSSACAGISALSARDL
jgi:hypothetical protein